MSTTTAEVRLNSFGVKDLLEAMAEQAAQEAREFARAVIRDLLRQDGATVDDVVDEVTREVTFQAVTFATLMNLTGGSFSGVQQDAAKAQGWAQVARDLRFTARMAVVAMAAGNEPDFTI